MQVLSLGPSRIPWGKNKEESLTDGCSSFPPLSALVDAVDVASDADDAEEAPAVAAEVAAASWCICLCRKR